MSEDDKEKKENDNSQEEMSEENVAENEEQQQEDKSETSNQEDDNNNVQEGVATQESNTEESSNTTSNEEKYTEKQRDKLFQEAAEEVSKDALILVKVIRKAFSTHWIVGLLLVLVIVVLAAIKSLIGENHELGYGSMVTKDTVVNDNITASQLRTERMEEFEKVRQEAAEKYLSDDDVTGYIEELGKYQNVIGQNLGQLNETGSWNNEGAGYQIIDQDRVIMLNLERLSYAFTTLEWVPEQVNDPTGKYKAEHDSISEILKARIDSYVTSDSYKYPNDKEIAQSIKDSSNMV